MLDDSLPEKAGIGLRQVGWDIIAVKDLFGSESAGSRPDTEVIPRCAAAGRIWVTTDNGALSEHRRLLRAHRLTVIVLRQPVTGVSVAYWRASWHGG